MEQDGGGRVTKERDGELCDQPERRCLAYNMQVRRPCQGGV